MGTQQINRSSNYRLCICLNFKIFILFFKKLNIFLHYMCSIMIRIVFINKNIQVFLGK